MKRHAADQGNLQRQLAAWTLLRRRRHHRHSARVLRRGPVIHVVIFDGTLSSLAKGWETNAGLAWKLLAGAGPRAGLSLWYEAGVQWTDWRATRDVIAGRGINRMIERAYGFLASRYRPGDRIFFLGYSRGAFAVRSLAGLIDRIGLLRADHATARNVALAYRNYRYFPDSEAAQAFGRAYCHDDTCIEMVGVWDTVKALGLRAPVLWRLTEANHAFHNHHLGAHILRGFHALAFDETREAFAPVMWESTPDRVGPLEQRWFPGTHPEVGGQISGRIECRPFSNVAFVWMMERAERAGLPLPPGWQNSYPQDLAAPRLGAFTGWGKYFLIRKRRLHGTDPSETFHPALDLDSPAAEVMVPQPEQAEGALHPRPPL